MNRDENDKSLDAYRSENVTGETVEDYRTESLESRPLDEFHGETIEVRAEQLQVRKREVEQGRVRIDKRVERVPFQEDIDLVRDVVEVRRVPRFEDLDAPPETRQEGDVTIIPVVEEILVVTRRYRVIEEVHVTTRQETFTERIEDELQREVVTVETLEVDPDIRQQ